MEPVHRVSTIAHSDIPVLGDPDLELAVLETLKVGLPNENSTTTAKSISVQ